jgi:hypothetical protein
MNEIFLLVPNKKGVVHALGRLCPNYWDSGKVSFYQSTLCEWSKTIVGGYNWNGIHLDASHTLRRGDVNEVTCKNCRRMLKRDGWTRGD